MQIILAIDGWHFNGLHSIQAGGGDCSFSCWYLRAHLPQLYWTKSEIKLYLFVRN